MAHQSGQKRHAAPFLLLCGGGELDPWPLHWHLSSAATPASLHQPDGQHTCERITKAVTGYTCMGTHQSGVPGISKQTL